MNSDLSTVFSDCEKYCSDDLLQVVEFFGTPGVGKTYLSDTSYEYLRSSINFTISKLPVNVGKMRRLNRVMTKMVSIFYIIVVVPSVILSVARLVGIFYSKRDHIFVKLVFNLLYVLGIIRFYKNKNQLLLMDQGIFQSIWSCIFYSDRTEYNPNLTTSLLLSIFSKIGSPKFLMVHVDAEEDNIKIRLSNRSIKGTSPLNTLNRKVIKRGLSATIAARDLLDYVAKKAPLFEIVDFAND